MSEEWAERQRQTNRLARRLASHVFAKNEVDAQQIYGLSRLGWITGGSNTTAYITSTKIPALGDIVGVDLSNRNLEQAAGVVAKKFNDDTLFELVLRPSGFTNFYNAYRNSARIYIQRNYSRLLSLYRAAYEIKNEEERLRIIGEIADLPGIPMANDPKKAMKPECFLTPAFFILDPEIRFPIINGNNGVKSLLRSLDAHHFDLVSQYNAMISMYGRCGIEDAADLDQIKSDLADFLSTKKLLKAKDAESDNSLTLKDEADVIAIGDARSLIHRRIHNQLTNLLVDCLKGFTLLEGQKDSCMYDALVKNYDGNKNDLLIEVKSSVESPHIRMAVGQLFNYWYELKGDEDHHLAILLSDRPKKDAERFLKWLHIGLMWFESNQLCTNDDWLELTLLR